MGHLDELVLDGTRLLHAVVFGGERGCADDDITHADLAAAVALTVIAREALHDHARELVFAVEEDILVGDEHVVEDDQGFLPAEFAVAHIDAAVLHLARVAGLAAVDHVQTLGIGGAGKRHGIVPVLLAHGDGGHEDVPVGVDGPRLVALRAADDDAIVAAFHDMHEHVGVGLRVGSLGAVALGVGHRAVHCQVVVLHIDEEPLEVLVVVRAALLVNFVGAGKDGVEGVHAHAALEAGGGLLPQQTLHFHLFHQVLAGLVQVRKAVYLMTRQAGGRGHKLLILRILRQRVGHGHAVDGRADHRVIHPVVDFLPEHVHAGVQLAQGVDVFLCGHQCHFRFLLHFIAWLSLYRLWPPPPVGRISRRSK